MNQREEIINNIKAVEPCNLSYVFNSVMVEAGYPDDLIWSLEHLQEDIEQGLFNTEWNITSHLIEDDFHKPTTDKEYICLDGYCNLSNISYQSALEQLIEAINNADETTLNYIEDCI